MLTQPLLFSDIQTTDLIFYDPDVGDRCFEFCQKRDIDCLPSLNDAKKFYQRKNTGFEEKDVPLDRCVDGQKHIFDPSILEKFRQYRLLFVMAGNQLTGVVHFCDYDRPAVHSHLFNLLSDYECALRKLFCVNTLNNQAMLDYYEDKIRTSSGKDKDFYKSRKRGYENNKARNEKLKAFECFYLSDLIELANYRKIIAVQAGTSDLRNKIMHHHDLVTLDDPYRRDLIFTWDSFELFFNQVAVLLHDYKKVNNRIALLSS